MTIQVDPVVAMSPIGIPVDPELRGCVERLAGERPLVIDYYASRSRAFTVGDLTVEFASGPLEPCYVELEPIVGVRVLAHRRLVHLLSDGAELHLAGLPFAPRVTVWLVRPERWLDYLELHPAPRR
jgi:hypothetical protein